MSNRMAVQLGMKVFTKGEYNRQTRGGALKAEGDLGQPVTGTPRPVIEQLIHVQLQMW